MLLRTRQSGGLDPVAQNRRLWLILPAMLAVVLALDRHWIPPWMDWAVLLVMLIARVAAHRALRRLHASLHAGAAHQGLDTTTRQHPSARQYRGLEHVDHPYRDWSLVTRKGFTKSRSNVFTSARGSARRR